MCIRDSLDTVMELKRRGFTDLTMQEWTFAHDNGKCPQMSKAHLYVEHWEQMRENNYGLLLWEMCIRDRLKELVRGSVEETLNELLEAEAEKLTQAARYERNEPVSYTHLVFELFNIPVQICAFL